MRIVYVHIIGHHIYKVVSYNTPTMTKGDNEHENKLYVCSYGRAWMHCCTYVQCICICHATYVSYVLETTPAFMGAGVYLQC